MLINLRTSGGSVLLTALSLLVTACSNPDAQKQKHFEQGNAYVEQKRDDFAVIEYANAVRIDPKFGEARWKLAQTYERMNNPQAAVPEYIRAADALPDDRDVQIKAAEILLVTRRYGDAAVRAATLLAKNPGDLDAILLRASALAGLRDFEGAISGIQEALKVHPADSRVYINLGGIHEQAGQLREAEAAYRQAIALNESSVGAHVALANFLSSNGRQADAEQELKAAIALSPRDELANRMLASTYMTTGRLAEAEQPLKILSEVSATPDATFQLAEYYLTVKRGDEAIRLLTPMTKQTATSVRAEAMLASIDYEKGRTKEAHARLDKLLERVPNDSSALALKASWLASENSLDAALERGKAAVAADTQSATAHFTLGGIHAKRYEYPDAMKEYTEALRINPRLVAAQVELARLNRATGNQDDSVRFAQEAKQAAPSSLGVRETLARSLLNRGDLDGAEQEIAALLKVAPDTASIHALNGRLLALRNREPAARAAYERALALSPDNVEAVGGLVALDLQRKQFAPALTRIEAHLQKEPNQLALLAIAARAYEVAGQHDKAEQALRRAIASEPRFMSGYALLAQLYLKQGRLDAARKEFEGVVKRDPRAAGERTMVGIILASQGKREEAKKWYEATVADLPGAAIAANNLALIYAEEGVNLDRALQLASDAKRVLPDSAEVSDTLGWVYYKKDLPALAVGPLEESARKLPNNAEVQYHLGMTYAKIGDKPKARSALERALKLDPKMGAAATARAALATVSE